MNAPATQTLRRMFLEVCGACQNNCDQCQHGEMRRAYAEYQMSLDDVDRLIDCTEESGYRVTSLLVNGVGEPTLWTHLNEGIARLVDSGLFEYVVLFSNGQSLNRIAPETWRVISGVSVNVYPCATDAEKLGIEIAMRMYGDKMQVKGIGGFRRNVTRCHPETLPCVCESPGPMYCAGRIWPYCGSVVFDAAKIAGTDPYADSFPIRVGYMDRCDDKRRGTFAVCAACNSNGKLLKLATNMEHRQAD